MKQDVKEDWVEALRSGEFVQGRAALDSRGRQCCLGVLAEIMDWPWERRDGDPRRLVCGNRVGSFGLLTDSLLHEVGLLTTQQNALAAMNDQGATFDEIADYIEAML